MVKIELDNGTIISIDGKEVMLADEFKKQRESFERGDEVAIDSEILSKIAYDAAKAYDEKRFKNLCALCNLPYRNVGVTAKDLVDSVKVEMLLMKIGMIEDVIGRLLDKDYILRYIKYICEKAKEEIKEIE